MNRWNCSMLKLMRRMKLAKLLNILTRMSGWDILKRIDASKLHPMHGCHNWDGFTIRINPKTLIL
jgi:hypothetical protein